MKSVLFYKKSLFLIVFFLFYISAPICPENIDFIFIAEGFEDDKKKIEVLNNYAFEIINFIPICFYSEFINFFYADGDPSNEIIKIQNNGFQIDSELFLEKATDLKRSKFAQYIVVVNSQSGKAKGGFISDIPIIVISSKSPKRTVLHELSHTLFKLGDEYGGILDFLPSEREILKFRNLSLVKYNEEWIRIKIEANDSKINFYEGGLERNKGVYRSYPECLMKNVKDDLCPVCLYYSNQILMDVTGKSIDYKELLKKKDFIKEKIYPSVVNLKIEVLRPTTKGK